MDPAVRDHLWHAAGTAQFAAARCLAARRSRELRDTVRRQSGGPAVDLPPATADFLFFEPVPVLSERHCSDYGVSDLGAHDAGPGLVAPARALHLRHHRHVLRGLKTADSSRPARQQIDLLRRFWLPTARNSELTH